jgi:hypothetical protein
LFISKQLKDIIIIIQHLVRVLFSFNYIPHEHDFLDHRVYPPNCIVNFTGLDLEIDGRLPGILIWVNNHHLEIQ